MLRIALTQRVTDFHGFYSDIITHDWYRYLAAQDINLVPNKRDQDLERTLRNNDLLIISGGDRHPVRDYIEYNLIELFRQAGKPIFGVCHGFQCLTMHFGGAIEPLTQHMACGHRVTDCQTNNDQWVNSYHSYRVARLPQGVEVLAVDAESKDCESWILGNIGGVMWHPERPPFDWIPSRLAQLLIS